MWIDTHCHLDDPSIIEHLEEHLRQAHAAHVTTMVVPAVAPAFFDRVVALAETYPACYFALGIHPLYIESLTELALEQLEDALKRYQHHPKLVAVGEIGLDFFVPQFALEPLRTKQLFFYEAQLKLARRWHLPVILHARKSHDLLLKYLRQYPGMRGICHAFNASFQQAHAFIELGFALGMGGAMTYSRALQIRRLATQLPLSAIVLETDAPDIPPEWLDPSSPNTPMQVAQIAQTLATLRGLTVDQLSDQILRNTYSVLPRLHPTL